MNKLHLSAGIKFVDEPRDYPESKYKLRERVWVLRTSGQWTAAQVAFIHALGGGEFSYTVRVDLDRAGTPRVKQFLPAYEIKSVF